MKDASLKKVTHCSDTNSPTVSEIYININTVRCEMRGNISYGCGYCIQPE